MKQTLIFLFCIIAFYSCSSDNNANVSNSDDEQEEIEAIPNALFTQIIFPNRHRDTSYHQNGFKGVFYHPDSTKTFKANMDISFDENIEISPQDFTVTWKSDIDGILFQGNPNSDLESEISPTLSKGSHKIWIESSYLGNPDFTVKDSITISNTIALSTDKTGRSVILNWTPYQGAGFESYLVYNEDFEPIAEIKAIAQTSLEYFTPSSFSEPSEYQIIVKTNLNAPHPLGSNFSYKEPGIFFKVPYFIRKMVKDPLRDRVYAIANPIDNSTEYDKYGILVINSETFEIIDHILGDNKYADMDINQDGRFLFLCQEDDSEKITKLNLNTFSFEYFPTDTRDWGLHKIEVGDNNVLFCHRDPPTSGDTQFWIYDGNTGALLRDRTGSSRHGDIEFNKTNQRLYAAHSNSTGARFYKHSVIDNVISNVSDSGVVEFFPDPYVLLSDDDQYVFWEENRYDANFFPKQSYPTNIKSCSPNNLLVAGINNVYKFNDASTVATFPEFPRSEFTSMLFIDDNTLIQARSKYNNYPTDETYFFKIPFN